MEKPGDEATKLRKIVLILAIALALVIGSVAGITITLALTGSEKATTLPAPTSSPSISATTAASTVKATPTQSAAPAGDTPVAPAAAPAQPAVACPTGTLIVKLNGALAKNTNGIIKVTAGWLLTNTDPRYAINVSSQSGLTLSLVSANGNAISSLRSWMGADTIINLNSMKVASTTHEGYTLNQWNQAAKLGGTTTFPDLKATWVGSGCRVPIGNGGQYMNLPVLR